MSTYYDLLGITPGADDASIRAAWRRMARIHHPDRHPHDPLALERFQAVVEAFHALGDAARRRAYDATLGIRTASHQPAGARGGDGPRGAAPRRGRIPDRVVSVGVPYAVNVSGGILQVPVPAVGTCPACDGRGAHEGEPCGPCDGSGHLAPAHVHPVRVQAGLVDGATLRIPGEGWPSENGRGDLVALVRLEAPRGLRRDGANVLARARVPRAVAMRGGMAEVAGPTGPFRFQVEPHTAPGSRLKFTGMGLVPAPGAARGDLEVTIECV